MTDPAWPALTTEELDDLGTPEPALLRSVRYRGTGQETELEHLTTAERDTVRLLYDHLRGIYEAWRRDPASPDWDTVARHTLALAEPGWMARVGRLGADAGGDDGGLQRVIHDLRGGAATAILAEAELLEPGLRSALERGGLDAEALEPVVLLARDQAKMMRNALVDLDPDERARDTEENPHRIDDLIDRWRDVRYRTLDGPIRVRAARDAPGLLSSCCLEFGAVDRITYNLINNAARHASDSQVALQARRVSGRAFRIVVTNRVTAGHGAWLAESLTRDAAVLFRWGSSRRPGESALDPGRRPGSGMGLAIAADFVAAAFGVPTAREAIEGGYLGSTPLDDRLAVWFHWPAYDAPPGPSEA